MTDDEFLTLKAKGEAVYTEKRSRFIGVAMPVASIDEVKEIIAQYQKEYYDARHICYAYMLGAERKTFRANDNGEPSGTAGKPILGQINSAGLTDTLVIVVRYFGGIKLGTSGLALAYKQAAAMAIEAGGTVAKTVDAEVSFNFEYPHLNDVMRIVKEESPTITEQQFDLHCKMTLSIRKSKLPALIEKLSKVQTLCINPDAPPR